MNEDYEILFWKEWLEANTPKRRELVKNLSLLKEALEITKFPEEQRLEILASSLNGFFEDLESAIYTKIRLEQNNKKSNS